jgi:hypothetical protein
VKVGVTFMQDRPWPCRANHIPENAHDGNLSGFPGRCPGPLTAIPARTLEIKARASRITAGPVKTGAGSIHHGTVSNCGL